MAVYEISLFLSLLTLCAVIFVFARSPQFSMFHPLFLYILFHGFIFVIRPIVAYFSEFDLIYRAYQFTPSVSDKTTVILASNLGFLVFTIACLKAGNLAMHFKVDRAAEIERSLLLSYFLWVMLVCVPLGGYSLSIVWNSAAETGVAYQDMVRDAATGISVNTKSNGYLMDAQLMLASSAAIFAWFFRFRIWALMPLAAFIIFRAGTGGRGPFIAALGAVILLYLYERQKRFPALKILAVIPAIMLFFSAVGDDRGSAARALLGNYEPVNVYNDRSNERFLEGMDYANMEYFEYLVYVVPQRSGTYGYFTDTLQIFTEPIPRVLWEGKPIGAPFQTIFLFDYGFPIGMTRSIPGQGWFSLGWLGVIIWSGAWGWALGAIYNRFVGGQQGTLSVLSYMIFLSALPLSYRDGQILTLLRQCFFFLAPITIWWAFARLTGLPSIAQVRLHFQKQSEPRSGKMQKTRKVEGLPPAVLRRRRAMAADAVSRSAENKKTEH